MTVLAFLSDGERFLVGVAFLLGALWLALILIRVLPTFLRESLAWCRHAFQPEPPKVVDFTEHRRRRELEAAAGRRAS